MLSDSGLQVTEVAERYEPFGPVTSERMEYLLARGYVKRRNLQNGWWF